MKREAKLLLQKASDSLLLSVELFNRPSDRGRISGTLVQLDPAFEMFLKAAIVGRGGRIRERRARETLAKAARAGWPPRTPSSKGRETSVTPELRRVVGHLFHRRQKGKPVTARLNEIP
jgi:hypothetical protein